MKKTIAALVLIGSPLLCTNVMAANGSINFTGTITGSACTVDTTSASQTVNLGNVSSTTFGSVGSAAAPTKFTINLTKCPASVSAATVTFDGAADAKNSNLLALGAGSTASGVGIGIYEADSATQIPLATASASQSLNSTADNALTYIAKYVSTDSAVTAGTVNAVSDFTVIYN